MPRDLCVVSKLCQGTAGGPVHPLLPGKHPWTGRWSATSAHAMCRCIADVHTPSCWRGRGQGTGLQTGMPLCCWQQAARIHVRLTLRLRGQM